MAGYNPIQSVDNATIPCPSAYVYKLSDISAADAGRTEDTTMDKMRIGQCVHLELRWDAVTDNDLYTILTAFNPEYISVTFRDGLTSPSVNNGFRTSTFYVGDRSAPLYNTVTKRWTNLSFNIIERSGRH